MEAKSRVREMSDSLGVALSVLCMIHCLCLPVLIAFAPLLLKGLPGDDVTHRYLTLPIAFFGFLAFRSGYKMHRRRWLLYLFIAGLLLISLAALLGDETLGSFGEAAITVCGGLLLVTAHLVNRSFCRSCALGTCLHPHSAAAAADALSPATPGENALSS